MLYMVCKATHTVFCGFGSGIFFHLDTKKKIAYNYFLYETAVTSLKSAPCFYVQTVNVA